VPSYFLIRRHEKTKGAHNDTKTPGALLAGAGRLVSFMSRYAFHFKQHTKSLVPQASFYLRGLMNHTIRKQKNIERMVEVDEDGDYESVQHFISTSPWSHRGVKDHVAQDVHAAIGDADNAGLAVDECGIAKKGDASVGVNRQYLGCLGKVDNGQVGVYATLVNGNRYGIIDARLYLPESWCADKKRLEKAHVPEEARTFKTKTELAYECVVHARNNNVKFGWVVGDSGYGNGLEFALKLEEIGELFVLDVACDQRIHLKQPDFLVPEYGGRGRKPTKIQPTTDSIRVDEWAKRQPANAWKKQTVREGTKKTIVYEFLAVRAWLYDAAHNTLKKWWLIVRRDIQNKSECKYSISNAPNTTKLKRLAYMQASRYWVERSFEDGKKYCGMADYQVRGWNGWHHHMSLVMMVMLFMLEEKITLKDEKPLLTPMDVCEIITAFLGKPATPQAVAQRVAERHKRHARALQPKWMPALHSKQRRMSFRNAKRGKISYVPK
jgi:SRSO17 transposase